MLILGLGGLGYRNSSAALVRDGRIVAAAAEDRFTRVKHTGGYPARAIAACLENAGVTLADVDHVAVANNPWLGLRGKVLEWYGDQFFESPEFRSYHIFHDQAHETVRYLHALEDLRSGREARFHEVPHHLSHMASSYLASGLGEAAILDMDGRGELSTSALGVGKGAAIEVFTRQQMPNSLGLLFAAVSDFLGFSGPDDEFRVMTVSMQGKPTFLPDFRKVVRPTEGGGFLLDETFFTHRDGLAALSQRFTEVFGERREAGAPVLQRHRDLAASLQRAIEEAVLHAARHLHERTGLSALCFCGGVALNWLVNGRLRAEGPFERVYVNPLAGDEGTAVGAALHVYAAQTGASPEPLESVALGPAHTDAQIEDTLRGTRQRYERVADPAAVAAERVAAGEILGWFEGRAEFGPRGLGQRAILADPSNPETKARILRDVKPREEHHPFALSLAAESAADVFGDVALSPYMLTWDRVLEAQRAGLRGVLADGGIARWQSVTQAEAPAFHAVLAAFADRTGRLPGLLNTSLNLPGRPPAVTAADALEIFATTGLDALVMGPFVVSK